MGCVRGRGGGQHQGAAGKQQETGARSRKAIESVVEKCDRERDERVRVVDLSALERPMRNKIGPTECCTMRQRTTASRDNGSP